MERLTFDGNFCDISKCGYRVCPYDGNCSQKKVWERLKQFEDAVQTPENFYKMYGELCLLESALKSYGGPERMKELAKADKDGRVVILPCKVDDTIYAIAQVLGGDGVHSEISPIQITGIGGNALNKVWLVSMVNRHEIRISPSEFGKTAFFTREEAEKALQEMEGKA